MGLFGPSVSDMKSKSDIEGLVRLALKTKKTSEFTASFSALAEIGGVEGNQALLEIIRTNSEWLDNYSGSTVAGLLTDKKLGPYLLKRFHAIEKIRPGVDVIFGDIESGLNDIESFKLHWHSALIGLLSYSNNERAFEILMLIMQEGGPEARSWAIQSLGLIGEPDAVDEIIRVFHEDAQMHNGLGVSTIHALQRIGDEKSVDFIKSLTNDEVFSKYATKAISGTDNG